MKKRSNDINDYPDAALLTPSKYLKKEELAASGPVALTILRIEPAHELKSERGTELKTVIFFRETDKGMVLNATNNGRMVECHGRDPRVWLGKKVVLKDGVNNGKRGVAVDVAGTIRYQSNQQPRRQQPAPQAPPPDFAPPDVNDDHERALADAARAAEQQQDEPGALG